VKIGFVYDLVYPFSKGGVEKRISDLARLMASRGHEVHVFGTKHWDGPAARVVDGVNWHGVCEPSLIHTKNGTRSVAQAWRFAWAAAREVGRYELDLVELQGMSPLTCLGVLARCRFTDIKPLVIWYEVWQEYWNEYLGLPGYLGRLIEWLVARTAPAQAASCRLAASRLETWGIKDTPVLPIGIDFYGIRAVPADMRRFEILYVGRLARHKNLDLLLDALSLLDAEGISPSVAIIGEGPEKGRLELLAESKTLSDVHFLGSIESDTELMSLIKSSRVFAFPSLREGFGIAPLEAAASGVPVVTVRHLDNAFCELVRDGVTGIITTPEPIPYAAALKSLLHDQSMRNEMGRRSAQAAEVLDWSGVVEQAEQLYQEVAFGPSQLVSERRRDSLASQARDTSGHR
jgi:glycosyltransferase involved in cell wall biosynthesis